MKVLLDESAWQGNDVIESYSEKWRYPLRRVLKFVRYVRNYGTLMKLRIIGCTVDWSAIVHPSAVFERSEGNISIGARTHIDRGVIIRALGGTISIGADCSVNGYSFLSGGGDVRIGDHVMIASHVSIYAANHVFSDRSLPMNKQGMSSKGIVLERDVWVGTGVRILDGVRVRTGSILAAGAVVNKSTEPYSVNGGVPARKIATRSVVGPLAASGKGDQSTNSRD
jgi:acetyltransferase-like isoleucine patch superfamily enzyme